MVKGAIHEIIIILRKAKAVKDCAQCRKVWYFRKADAQAIADLTLALDGEVMLVYPDHRGWHLRNGAKYQQKRLAHIERLARQAEEAAAQCPTTAHDPATFTAAGATSAGQLTPPTSVTGGPQESC
jgi:hypothetical protein